MRGVLSCQRERMFDELRPQTSYAISAVNRMPSLAPNPKTGALLVKGSITTGVSDNNQLDLIANALVEQVNQVIRRLGLETRKAHESPRGSDRYRRVFFAHERLVQAQQVFTRPTIAVWKTVAGDGHSGDFLMQKVGNFLTELECLGEGPNPHVQMHEAASDKNSMTV